ncbi:MAG: Acetylornithine deacetylase [uncultured Thermomicrobiales bacterium]|uniref:Acetylornithine deacetylase n=1 Tax=uncultured Thermomicrobiales bacterium TaxID=1645740 RepID=A0A6J4UVH6_9BACT|nr:MAG: Acetylornithine deacetylase [uncultured Thermomicrobiales bacterium]
MPVPAAELVAAARAAAATVAPHVLELAASIAEVPAPTGEEAPRARFVAGLLRAEGAAGVAGVAEDAIGDVVAVLPGTLRSPTVLIAAHTDTVFPAGTPIRVAASEGRLAAPGIGDNSLGVAALVALPGMLRAMGATPAVSLVLAATVGEEGLGNLRGIRAVVDGRDDIAAALALEGHNLGRVTHIAVGSRRLRVTLHGPGGHSWGDHGRPSAIHALGRLVAALDEIPLSDAPKTTLNVGVVEGGLSVNTIAPTASLLLDLRSTDASALAALSAAVERRCAAVGGGVSVEVDVLGDRPAGVVPPGAPVVRRAAEALSALGMQAVCDASSTDANIPISRGIPAVCLGLTTGGNAHRTDEFIDVAPVTTGLAQLALVALAVAGDVAAGRAAPAAA